MPATSVGADGTLSLSDNGSALEPLMAAIRTICTVFGWGCTMIFVGIGWLLFFYPVEKAVTMAVQLFTW